MSERPTPETPIQILQNGQGRFRSDIEELFEKRSLEVVRAVSQVIKDHTTLKKELDEARELHRKALSEREATEKEVDAMLERLLKVERERDEARDILRKLLEIIPEPECHDFGHTKEERHTFFEKCPVMERYDALIAQAEEAAK